MRVEDATFVIIRKRIGACFTGVQAEGKAKGTGTVTPANSCTDVEMSLLLPANTSGESSNLCFAEAAELRALCG